MADERRPEDFGPWGTVLALHLIGRVVAGVVEIPAAVVVAAVAHVACRSWAVLTLGDTLAAMVVLPLGESLLGGLGAWFVIGRGDGRGQILTDGQLRALTLVSAIAVGTTWYAIVSGESARGALVGAVAGLGFGGILHLMLREASRREAAKTQEERDARDAAMHELLQRTAAEIREDREERLFRFAEKRRQKRRERMRRRQR